MAAGGRGSLALPSRFDKLSVTPTLRQPEHVEGRTLAPREQLNLAQSVQVKVAQLFLLFALVAV